MHLRKEQASLESELAPPKYLVALIGFVIYGVVAAIERFAIPWHVSQR